MNASQQASGGREAWPRDASYPFRVTVWDRVGDGEWTLQLVYECPTEQEAHEDAQAILRAYGGDGIAMHYYVGEVA
jgi:hypothetical protein